MKIVLLQTGKTSDRNISMAVEEYILRIKKYNSFEIITIPDQKNTRNMPVTEQKIREGKKILEILNADDHVILLDEKGREMSTVDLSVLLGKMFMLSKKRIIFVIGGPWGFSDEVYSRADFKLSLSRLTFSHQMVRLLFMEQLYRILTIIKGEAYHHE
jgi:23S rRNA (pseudouridine1915-N3)-methyltransferase